MKKRRFRIRIIRSVGWFRFTSYFLSCITKSGGMLGTTKVVYNTLSLLRLGFVTKNKMWMVIANENDVWAMESASFSVYICLRAFTIYNLLLLLNYRFEPSSGIRRRLEYTRLCEALVKPHSHSVWGSLWLSFSASVHRDLHVGVSLVLATLLY